VTVIPDDAKYFVIPGKDPESSRKSSAWRWIPVFTGMTNECSWTTSNTGNDKDNAKNICIKNWFQKTFNLRS
jgi:hypothetical protein